MSVDAIVIGAGPNGLAGANVLAERGWSVLVLEAQPEPGGAVRSGQVIEPGFETDLYSAFYPLGANSPVLCTFGLERHGLRWRRSPVPVAHPRLDGSCAAISLDLQETVASVARFAPADGAAWRRMYAGWERIGDAFIEALFDLFPLVRSGARLLARLPPRGCSSSFALRRCRSVASRRRSSPATERAGCSAATPCTPTWHPSRRPAPSTAGCCAAAPSNSASPHPRAAPGA